FMATLIPWYVAIRRCMFDSELHARHKVAKRWVALKAGMQRHIVPTVVHPFTGSAVSRPCQPTTDKNIILPGVTPDHGLERREHDTKHRRSLTFAEALQRGRQRFGEIESVRRSSKYRHGLPRSVER